MSLLTCLSDSMSPMLSTPELNSECGMYDSSSACDDGCQQSRDGYLTAIGSAQDRSDLNCEHITASVTARQTDSAKNKRDGQSRLFSECLSVTAVSSSFSDEQILQQPMRSASCREQPVQLIDDCQSVAVSVQPLIDHALDCQHELDCQH